MFAKSNLNFTTYSLCFIIVLFGILFRVYNINLDAFWWDEIVSFWISDPTISLEETLLRHHKLDGSPPIFNITLKYFHKIFGYETTVGRFLSAILGIFSFIIISITALQFKDKSSFILLLFLSSFNVYLISASQEMRQYSMLIFFSALTILLFYKILNEQQVKKNIFYVFCFFLFQTLTILCHPFGLILFFSVVLFLSISYFLYNKNFYYLNISNILIFFISIFFLYFYLFSFNLDIFPTWIDKENILKFLTNLYFSKFFGSRILGLLHLVILVFLIVKFRKKLFTSFDKRLLLLIFIFLSYFVPIIYGFLFKPILTEKYIIFVIIPVLIVLSNLLFEIKNKVIKKFLIFIIVVPTILNLFSESTVRQFFDNRPLYKPDFHSTFKEIEKSNNKNFLFTLKERESNVNNHILDALDNFVIKYSKENNFELYHHRKLNKNMLKDNSFWSICLFEINFDCTDPWIEKRTTTIKQFNFNRIHLKLLMLN